MFFKFLRMKKFEQQLLESGSLELICSYVEEHKEILSREFQEALKEKIKIILQVIGSHASGSCDTPAILPSKEEILSMDLKDFFNRFYNGYHIRSDGSVANMPKCFFQQCQENNILTAKDLLNFGRFNVLKMRNIGRVNLRKIEETFERAGLEF